MAPVDSVRPPTKKIPKKEKPSTGGADLRKPKKEREDEGAILPPRKPPTEGDTAKERKLKVIVGLVALIIFAFWLFLFQGGKLVSPGESNNFGEIREQLSDLWDRISETVQDVEDVTDEEELEAELEMIRALEEDVFPQFYNSNVNANANTNVAE